MAMTALKDDPRWRRVHNRPWKCLSCDDLHFGLPDLGSDAPDFWTGSLEKAENDDARGAENILTEDFCIINGKDFFVRAVLPLPIIGAEGETFGLGVWVSLSEKNFTLYNETFGADEQSHLGPWFGWFCNSLKGYPDTLSLKTQVHPADDGKRPWIELEATDHPLAVEQRDGISFDRILELYALNGHDMRSALTD